MSYLSPIARITGLWRSGQPQGPYWVGGAAWGTGVTLTTHTTPFCTILLDPIWSGSCTKHREAPYACSWAARGQPRRSGHVHATLCAVGTSRVQLFVMPCLRFPPLKS